MNLTYFMKSLKIASILLAVVGSVMVFGAVGSCDYYTLELGQETPMKVWTTMRTGLILMIPASIYVIRRYPKGE